MTDLVTEDDREAVGVDRHRQDAGVHGHLPARQRKGVLLLRIVDDREAPLVVRLIRRCREPPADGLHRRNDSGARVDAALGEHLLVRLGTELRLLLGRDQHQLGTARVGRGRAAGEDDERREHGTAAHGAPITGAPWGGNAGLASPSP